MIPARHANPSAPRPPPRMSYKTVGELLKHVADYQQTVREYCEAVADRHEDAPAGGGKDERAAAMLDYFAGHEREAEKILNNYAASDRQGILDTWLQHTSEDDLRTFFNSERLDPTDSMETAVGKVVEFDRALIEMYRSLADNSQVPPRVQGVFQNLLEMEEWQKFRNAWSASESVQFSEGTP